MVENAEKAGFNPLTALRNGGSAGFTSTTTPALSPIATIAGGIGDFLTNFDPHADQKVELESQLVKAQIGRLNSETAYYSRMDKPGSFNVPTHGGSAGGGAKTLSGGSKSAALSASVAPQTPTPGEPTYTNPWETYHIDGRIRDTDAFAQRYGDSEIAQMIFGAHVGYRDYVANTGNDPLKDAKRGLDAVKDVVTNPSGHLSVTKLPTLPAHDRERKAKYDATTPFSYLPKFEFRWR